MTPGQLELAARGSGDVFWTWDLRTGEVTLSERLDGILGLTTPHGIIDLHGWLAVVHPDDRSALRESLGAHAAGDFDRFELEYRIAHADGTWVWLLCRGIAVRSPEGEVISIAGAQSNVTFRREAEERLHYEALHDALTGLPNRGLFMNRLQHLVQRLRRSSDRVFGVAFVDLDRFKQINDIHGHQVGDRLLSAVAQRLMAVLRGTDTVARLGGDEFALILEDVSSEQALKRVAFRLIAAFSSPFIIGDRSLEVTASLGAAMADRPGDSADDLLANADASMYRAKSDGRNRFVLFDESMRSDVLARRSIQSDLADALCGGQLRVHYQPIFDMGDPAPVGFEALMRWQHPERGLLLPGQFMDAAEDGEHLERMSNWVMDEAIRQVAGWSRKTERSLTVAVNVCAAQISHPAFVEFVRAALDRHQFPAEALQLEVAESTMQEYAERSSESLTRLRRMGVVLAMDDFGTGYCSIAHLQRLPIDVVKIDRTFVAKMNEDSAGKKLVQALVAFAAHLDRSVVAEGVETEQQSKTLREMACPRAQGYLYSRPLPPTEAEALLNG